MVSLIPPATLKVPRKPISFSMLARWELPRVTHRSMIFGFWFLILGLIGGRVAFHDQIAPGASHDRGAIAPSITVTATRPG